MAKRARSTSASSRTRKSGRYSKKISKGTTKYVDKIWPYSKPGMSQMWDPFPAQAQAILRYNTTIQLDPTIGVPDSHLFRANGLQDPDFTGIGHQPYGHDTYQTIYNHYQVVSATITITPLENFDGMIGCCLTDDSSVSGDFDTIKELKGTRMRAMGANGVPTKLVNYFNVNQNFDIPFQKSTSASFGANPSEDMIFHVWACAKNASSTDSVSLNIAISYVVKMWELRDLGQS